MEASDSHPKKKKCWKLVRTTFQQFYFFLVFFTHMICILLV